MMTRLRLLIIMSMDLVWYVGSWRSLRIDVVGVSWLRIARGSTRRNIGACISRYVKPFQGFKLLAFQDID